MYNKFLDERANFKFKLGILSSMCYTYFYWHAKNVQIVSSKNSKNQRRQ